MWLNHAGNAGEFLSQGLGLVFTVCYVVRFHCPLFWQAIQKFGMRMGIFFFQNLAAKKEKVRALTRFSRSGSCAIKGENLAGEKAGKTLVLLMSRGHDRCPYAFKVPGSPPWCEDTNYGVGKFPVLGMAALLLGHLTACLYFSPLSRGSVFQTSASSPLQHSLAFVLGVCLILSHRMEDCLL